MPNSRKKWQQKVLISNNDTKRGEGDQVHKFNDVEKFTDKKKIAKLFWMKENIIILSAIHQLVIQFRKCLHH